MFQEYDFKEIFKLWRLNVGPDHPSCIKIGEEPTNLEGLLDAEFFVVCITGNHFADIIHFLTIGKAPEGYTHRQNKELVVHAIYFSVIAGHLYKMGSNKILCRYVPDFE